jgi:hypothetical protein
MSPCSQALPGNKINIKQDILKFKPMGFCQKATRLFLTDELFILIMFADPKPKERVALEKSHGTKSGIYPQRPRLTDFFKTERRVFLIVFPQMIDFPGPLLYFRWQTGIGFPEFRSCRGLHRAVLSCLKQCPCAPGRLCPASGRREDSLVPFPCPIGQIAEVHSQPAKPETHRAVPWEAIVFDQRFFLLLQS